MSERKTDGLALAALSSIEYDCHGTALSAPTQEARDAAYEEVKRLREALKFCADTADPYLSPFSGRPDFRDVARAALAPDGIVVNPGTGKAEVWAKGKIVGHQG